MLRIYTMLFFILKWIFISLLLIVLLHYLYTFFKSTLTVPKVRDLVNKPTLRYNEILDTIKNANQKKETTTTYGPTSYGPTSYGPTSYGPTTCENNMQFELRNFLQDLKKQDTIPKPEHLIIGSNVMDGALAFSNL